MNVVKYFLVGMCVLLVHFLCRAQSQSDQILRKRIENYRNNEIHEKIFLHLDQRFYLTGESIRFKVYVSDGTSHKPLSLSKVAYIEVVNHLHKVVEQMKISLENGQGHGSLYLPTVLPSGMYYIRAYTNWMKNYSADFFFHQQLAIINPFIELPLFTDDQAKQRSISVKFFPEGGSMVNDLRGKVAFKITDGYGKGLDVCGVILNQRNDTVARFRPFVFGIGSFIFNPKEGDEYRAILLPPDSKSTMHLFPKANSDGFVMNISDENDNFLKVTVFSKTLDAPSNLYLVMHTRMSDIKVFTSPITSNQALFLINKSEIRAGVSNITVLDTNYSPIAERLYFSHPDEQLIADVATDATEYKTRKKVRLSIYPRNASDSTKLSVAIVRDDTLFNLGISNIHQYLSLSSDLPGEVESPKYYFSKTNDAKIAVDNLMLTYHAGRFRWDQIVAPRGVHKFLPEYRGQIVSAKVTSENGDLLHGITALLSSPSKNISLYSAKSNDEGILNFEAPAFTGKRRLVIQAHGDTICQFSLVPPYSENFRDFEVSRFYIDSTFKAEILRRSIAMQVQNTYNRNVSADSAASSSAFFGVPDERYFLDKYIRFPVMEEVLREYVFSVMVRKRKDGFHLNVSDKQRIAILPDPLVLLDGVPVLDVNRIMAFNPLKIRTIDVVARKYFLGPLTFNGIVSYQSYTGDLSSYRLEDSALSTEFEGPSLAQPYTTPDYSRHNLTRIPDQRYLLYWNPSVNTVGGDVIEVEFFTSDIYGNYIIHVQGTTSNGQMGSSNYRFSVVD